MEIHAFHEEEFTLQVKDRIDTQFNNCPVFLDFIFMALFKALRVVANDIRADIRIVHAQRGGSLIALWIIVGERYGHYEWQEAVFPETPAMPFIMDALPPSVAYKTILYRAVKYLYPLEFPLKEDAWQAFSDTLITAFFEGQEK